MFRHLTSDPPESDGDQMSGVTPHSPHIRILSRNNTRPPSPILSNDSDDLGIMELGHESVNSAVQNSKDWKNFITRSLGAVYTFYYEEDDPYNKFCILHTE